ncbi:MAG: hypothetical protein QM831_21180 [Kofleriaceae bacterium]
MRVPIVLSLFVASTAFADPKLVMKGHDAGEAIYADKCANGKNSDDATRAAFVANMIADKSSKLSQAMAKLAEQDYEVTLGDWTHTFHLRDGCGDNYNSFSALILKSSTMGNSHELFAFSLVTIDDDDNTGKRSFKLRSITPVTGRSKP